MSSIVSTWPSCDQHRCEYRNTTVPQAVCGDVVRVSCHRARPSNLAHSIPPPSAPDCENCGLPPRIAVTEVQLRGRPAHPPASPDASPIQEACAEDRRCVAENTIKKGGCAGAGGGHAGACACKPGFFGHRCETAVCAGKAIRGP
jgi:hypothetical protein